MCGAARWTGARELSREWSFCSANITQPTAANRRCSKLEVAPSYRSTVTHPLLYEQEYVMKINESRPDGPRRVRRVGGGSDAARGSGRRRAGWLRAVACDVSRPGGTAQSALWAAESVAKPHKAHIIDNRAARRDNDEHNATTGERRASEAKCTAGESVAKAAGVAWRAGGARAGGATENTAPSFSRATERRKGARRGTGVVVGRGFSVFHLRKVRKPELLNVTAGRVGEEAGQGVTWGSGAAAPARWQRLHNSAACAEHLPSTQVTRSLACSHTSGSPAYLSFDIGLDPITVTKLV